jgi:hypothetical protein
MVSGVCGAGVGWSPWPKAASEWTPVTPTHGCVVTHPDFTMGATLLVRNKTMATVHRPVWTFPRRRMVRLMDKEDRGALPSTTSTPSGKWSRCPKLGATVTEGAFTPKLSRMRRLMAIARQKLSRMNHWSWEAAEGGGGRN